MQKILLSIGIDVAKAKFDAAFVFDDGSNLVETFENSNPGIKIFLRKVGKQKTALAVPCVLESTGQYHLNIALRSRQAGLRVSVINPLITKKYQRSSIRNAKTDSIDALRLAEIGLKEAGLPLFEGNTSCIEAKKLAVYVAKLEKVRIQIIKSSQAVEAMRGVTGLKVDLKCTKTALRKIDEQISVFMEQIKGLAPKEAQILSEKVSGLSHGKAAVVLSMLSDKKFESRDALIAFVGLDVCPRQSGAWRGKGRLSKRGNSYLRKVLFQVAWGLKQHNPPFRQKYDELREKGLSYVSSMNTLARKFLRILYSWYWQNHACPQFKF